jgi:hypothetical protein
MRKSLALVATILLALAGSAAYADDEDAGITQGVVGGVTVMTASGTAAQAKPFMKIRNGDVFQVPPGGEVRLMYLDSARYERWTGPATFRIGKGQSTAVTAKPAEARVLPEHAARRIAKVPDIIAFSRLGGVGIRSLPSPNGPNARQKEALRVAHERFEELRKSAPDDDITPELYLYSVLDDYQQYGEMEKLVADMRRRQPSNEALASLEAWVNQRKGR